MCVLLFHSVLFLNCTWLDALTWTWILLEEQKNGVNVFFFLFLLCCILKTWSILTKGVFTRTKWIRSGFMWVKMPIEFEVKMGEVYKKNKSKRCNNTLDPPLRIRIDFWWCSYQLGCLLWQFRFGYFHNCNLYHCSMLKTHLLFKFLREFVRREK